MPGAVHKRPIGTTLARYGSRRTSGSLITSIPKAAATLLELERGDYVAWERAAGSYRLFHSGKKADGARRVQGTYSKRIVLPHRVANGLHARDGGMIDWHVVSLPGGRWHIHAKAAAGPRQSGHFLAKSGTRRGSRLYEHVIASTNAHRYGGPATTRFPESCHGILGLRTPGTVRWVAMPRYHVVEPCGVHDPGARSVRNSNRTKGTVSHRVKMPAEVAAVLCPGDKSRLGWSVAADGMGRWEIRVRRTDGPENK